MAEPSSPSKPPANPAVKRSRDSPRRLASDSPHITPAATATTATEAIRDCAGPLPEPIKGTAFTTAKSSRSPAAAALQATARASGLIPASRLASSFARIGISVAASPEPASTSSSGSAGRSTRTSTRRVPTLLSTTIKARRSRSMVSGNSISTGISV